MSHLILRFLSIFKCRLFFLLISNTVIFLYRSGTYEQEKWWRNFWTMEVQFTTWNFILMNFYWLQLRRIKLSTFGTWSPSISFPSLKRIRDLSGTKSREIVNEIKGFINQGLIQRQSVFGLWSMQKAKKGWRYCNKVFFADLLFSHGCLFNKVSRYKIL